MSTRTRTVRCSQCGQHGHNRRTCDAHAEINREIHSAIVMCSSLTKKCEKVISKKVEKKPEPEKHNCPICCCDIKEEKDSMCLPCGHHFHVTCGLKWLQHNNTCPCCRAECGEKPKKLAVLNENVSAALAGELFNSSNILLDISQQNQSICEYPWNYPGYKQYVNTGYVRVSTEFIDYSEEELKVKWDEESPGTQIRLKCRFLYQHNAMSLGSMMMQGFASARLYQEGDFDLSEVLVNQAESGTISVQIPIAPTDDELIIEDEDDEDNFANMPELEDDDTDTDVSIDDLPDILSVTDYMTSADQSILQAADTDLPFTIEELEVDESLDVPTTPEPAPIQVPNAPRRPRRANRSTAQSPPPSPRAVADQHVTRRSSERIRQRYRRRRLQEEQDYSLTM